MMKTRLSVHAAVPINRDAQAKKAEKDRITVPVKEGPSQPTIVIKCK
jgi:hypothetical protein